MISLVPLFILFIFSCALANNGRDGECNWRNNRRQFDPTIAENTIREAEKCDIQQLWLHVFFQLGKEKTAPWEFAARAVWSLEDESGEKSSQTISKHKKCLRAINVIVFEKRRH